MTGSFLLIILIGLLGMLVQSRLKNKFKKYSQLHLQNGMSGKEIAEKMLADHQIYDVQVISTPGSLTDHYNPQNKTVNLSEAVYSARNASAAAVAAHECGHAVQHAKSYAWLQLRSKIGTCRGDFVQTCFLFINCRYFHGAGISSTVVLGIVLFAATVIFTLVTLPVEYDASNRALAWLEEKNMVTNNEHDAAKDALKWAARTYVVAALGSIATLLYYVNIYNSRS